MADVELWVLAVMAVAMFAGAFVQSTVGIGLGLMAAPVVTLVAPQLMPATMLLLVSTLPMLTLAREREDIDWGGIAWTTPPRILGTGAGVLLIVTVDERGLGLVVGVLVLLAVLLTWRAVHVPVNRATLTGVGFASGVMGTATSIGGPPMALLLQHREPRQIRTTLAVYFLLGAGMSAIGLSIAGQVAWAQVQVSLLMLPVLLVGVEASRRLKDRMRPEAVRPAVLVVCALSSAALVVRSLLA